MKKLLMVASLFSILAEPVDASDTEVRAAASRAAIKEFFAALKGELVTAIQAGGPVNAIDVCKQSASVIAVDISETKGWRVARTSLKLRNPANAPDGWERKVLGDFERRKQAGEDVTKLEFQEVAELGGKKVFRYMKAIPTAEKPCLACHGKNLAPGVAEALAEHYPGDRARGYEAGDIRGAFTITQPME